MDGDSNQDGDAPHGGTHSVNGTAPDRRATADGLPEWEGAVGRDAACLRATAKRYRVRARNPARAALMALQRHGLDGPSAREAGACVAIYLLPDSRSPRAVFAVGGTHDAPALHLRAADLLPPVSPLLGSGGPFDAAAIEAEIPRAARRRAQARVGSSGLREVLHGTFWQREATLYSSTAMVLAALGFPMSAEVFAVGGVVLLLQGAVRLALRESRIALATSRLRADPAAAETLRSDAVRTLFARAHGIAGRDGQPRRRILREAAAIPDLCGAARLHVLLDEDAAVTTGPAGGQPGPTAAGSEADDPQLPPSDNQITIVFRRPARRPADAPAPAQNTFEPAEPPRNGAGLPAVVPPVDPAEEIEVIEAELLDPEAYYADEPHRSWWA